MTEPIYDFSEGHMMAQYRYDQAATWVRGHSCDPTIGSRDDLAAYLAKHRPEWLPALDGLPVPGMGG